jgi:transglutaminase-like putative cysteine protease
LRYRITHKTWYAYSELAPVCHNLVHLAPRELDHQKCSEYRLAIDPAPAFFATRPDYFGNRTEYFSIESGHRSLEIVAESVVEVHPLEETSIHDVPWEDCVVVSSGQDGTRSVQPSVEPMHAQLTFASPRVPLLAELREYAAKSFVPKRSIVQALVDLNVRIHHEFKFDPRATTVDTPLWEVLNLRRGVCQDFAHLATGCLRSMGIAARYVSGYLRTTSPPGKPRLTGADASHAWCSAWCGPLGWVDFDPTNNCLVGDSYVTIAWGRDYSDVCPIQGVFVGGGEHRISVSVDVAPIG